MLASTPSTFSNWRAVFGSMGALPAMISLMSFGERPQRRANSAWAIPLGFETFLKYPPRRGRVVRLVLVGLPGHRSPPRARHGGVLASLVVVDDSSVMVIAVTWLMSMPPSSVRGTGVVVRFKDQPKRVDKVPRRTGRFFCRSAGAAGRVGWWEPGRVSVHSSGLRDESGWFAPSGLRIPWQGRSRS